MPLKVTRVSAGNYLVIVHGETYAIYQGGMYHGVAKWHVVRSSDARSIGGAHATKKAAVSALETLARQPQDRVVSDTLKLFRRGEIKKGTKLTVEGIRGKCSFDAYTRKDDGSEWIDITVLRTLTTRVVRPDKIKTVHRK